MGNKYDDDDLKASSIDGGISQKNTTFQQLERKKESKKERKKERMKEIPFVISEKHKIIWSSP
jgi:hypothetical protein